MEGIAMKVRCQKNLKSIQELKQSMHFALSSKIRMELLPTEWGINGIFILKIISKYKPVYSQSTNPCKAILLEYIPTF